MVTEAERLGMLGRRANRRSTEQRYHPLVREFLEDRLGRELGAEGVNDLHVTVARWAEPSDWRTAAHHYAVSRHWPDLQRVLEAHLQTIVASGAFSAAADYVRQFPEPPRSAAVEVVLSRQASVEGDIEQVDLHARMALELEPENDMAIGNVMASMFLSGDLGAASIIAEDFARTARTPLMRTVAEATRLIIACSVDADLTKAATFFEEFADHCRAEGLAHFEGVTLLNLANIYRAQGAFEKAYGRASSALDVLSSSSSGNELAAAQMVRATILAYRGDLESARAEFAEGVRLRHAARSEYLVELADLECLLGDAALAGALVDEAGVFPIRSTRDAERIIQVGLLVRAGDATQAMGVIETIEFGRPSPNAAYQSRGRATRALVMAMAADPRARGEALAAQSIATRQGAHLWRELASLVVGFLSGQTSAAVMTVPSNLHCVISFAAELVASRLATLDSSATSVVEEEAHLRPQRWLPLIRRLAASVGDPSAPPAARLLDKVGQLGDVAFLRSLAREPKASPGDRRLGKTLARRLAAIAVVEDLGRVHIRIGAQEVGGQDVRRKVLSLLCFLLTRPRFSATREEVMDAMWPEMDPSAAVNSLNQSVYYLRRVFEPE
jgi:tetratricopeptide (TPR) repeat protein